MLLAEVIKFAICLGMAAVEAGGCDGLVRVLRAEVVAKPRETWHLGVPALCFTVQNNLVFVALAHLSAAAAQARID